VKNVENILYVIGFQRSGTTLLCHLLDKHPEITCAEEPEITKRITYEQFDLLKDPEFDSIRKSLEFYGIDKKEYVFLVNNYLTSKFDTHTFIRKCYELFNKKNAKITGAKEVCDLTAFNYDYLTKLSTYHENKIKIVFIERDPKGVVNSFRKMGFFPPGRKEICFSNLKKFVKEYLKCMNYIYKNLLHLNTHYLLYEDLINDSTKELKKIYEFLNVDSSNKIINDILVRNSKGIRINFNGVKNNFMKEWNQTLNDNEKKWIEKKYNKFKKKMNSYIAIR